MYPIAAALSSFSAPLPQCVAHRPDADTSAGLVASLNRLGEAFGLSIQIVDNWQDGCSIRHRSDHVAQWEAKDAVTITLHHAGYGYGACLPVDILMRVEESQISCDRLAVPNDRTCLLRAIVTAGNAVQAWKEKSLELTYSFRQPVASDQDIADLSALLAEGNRSAVARASAHMATGLTIEPEDGSFLKAILRDCSPRQNPAHQNPVHQNPAYQNPNFALAQTCLAAGDFLPPANAPDVYDLALAESVLDRFADYLGCPLFIQHASDGLRTQASSAAALPKTIEYYLTERANIWQQLTCPAPSHMRIYFFSQKIGTTFSIYQIKTGNIRNTCLIMLPPHDDKPLCRAVATAKLLMENWHKHPQAAGDADAERVQRLLSAP